MAFSHNKIISRTVNLWLFSVFVSTLKAGIKTSFFMISTQKLKAYMYISLWASSRGKCRMPIPGNQTGGICKCTLKKTPCTVLKGQCRFQQTHLPHYSYLHLQNMKLIIFFFSKIKSNKDVSNFENSEVTTDSCEYLGCTNMPVSRSRKTKVCFGNTGPWLWR